MLWEYDAVLRQDYIAPTYWKALGQITMNQSIGPPAMNELINDMACQRISSTMIWRQDEQELLIIPA